MKNKNALIIVLILSFSLIFSLVYINFFTNSLYLKDFKEIETVEVFNKYNKNKEILCYGNKRRCKKVKYKVTGKVNIKKLGKYKLTYTAKRKKLEFKKVKTIEVVDTTKPELIVEGSFTNVCKNGKNNDVILKATDNYDGDLTDKIEYKLEGNKVIYKVTDSSNNIEEKEFDIIINDIEKPKIILNGDNTLYLSIGSKYKELGYSAIDNCDGDLTDIVKVDSNLDTSKVGSYEIKYSVTDSSDNITTIKRSIKVFPKNEYTPGDSNGKVIYLTFDDGPGSYTERLLNILSTYNVKVTFFVTGYNNNFNHLLKRELDEGHTVALHSYSHRYEDIYSSVDAYMNDLLAIQNKVKEHAGIESKIIRFPGGSSNTISRKYRIGIMSEITKKVEEIGFRYFDWTIASGDAGNTTSSDKIVENVTNGVKEGALNVVLMHDIKSYTVDSIERIIQFGLSNGYSFAPLTMESPVCHQKINN